MVNQDFGFQLKQLSARISALEDKISSSDKKSLAVDDWDISRIMREWSISKRTVANYRKRGLASFKRGGRVIFSCEARKKFINENNSNVEEGMK